MFITPTHLPQELPTTHYSSPEQFDVEKERIFRSAWHFIGTTADFPNDGDFRTFKLLGRPVLLRRDGDQFHAYLNVCAHRFSMLSHQECGNMPALRCQYHGWEYSASGDTRKIPDAKSFKPLEKGKLGLTSYRLERCGQLLFVSLTQDGPTLKEYLGQRHDLLADWFGGDRRQMLSYHTDTKCNWKAYLENGLESYHVNTVHKDTLLVWPDEATCTHDLRDLYTKFETTHEDPRKLLRRFDRMVHRVMRRQPEPYTHIHVYPHFTFIRMSLATYIEAAIPIGPEETRVICRGFRYLGHNPTLLQRGVSRLFGRFSGKLLQRIQEEDCDILQLCQHGLRSPEHPQGGLISAREERIFHFQQWVKEQTA